MANASDDNLEETIEEVSEDPPDTADHYDLAVGEIMTTEFVSVHQDTSVDDAIDHFQAFAPDDPHRSTIYYVYVVDDEDRIVGVASLRELLGAPGDDPISTVVAEDVITFEVDADAQMAAVDVAQLTFSAVPVVDENDRLVGIVRSDELIGVIEEETTEDLLRMQGLDLPDQLGKYTDIETKRSSLMLEAPIWQILRIRIPWLIVALAGGLLAGLVIGVYEDALQEVVFLAFFIPVVMDMGGNVGTQSSTIFIRGVVLGHVDRSNVVHRILKESVVGAIIGIVVGGVAAMAAFFWIDLNFALVVFGAMVGTCIVAALVGFLIPWLVYLIGSDPAAASNPIITTIKDVSGLLIYFTLALVLLPELAEIAL